MNNLCINNLIYNKIMNNKDGLPLSVQNYIKIRCFFAEVYKMSVFLHVMRKHIFFLIVIFSVSVTHAQEASSLERINRLLTKRADVDTTRIYQPKPGFAVGLISSGQKAGFDVDVNFSFDDGTDGLSQYSLSENLCKKAGLDLEYGSLALSYSFELGRRSAQRKLSFGLDLMRRTWGLRFNYFSITNPFVSSLTLGHEGADDYFHDEIVTDEVATLKSFTIDGYYVFNNKRFAYPAAYKIGLIQRRTTGSWIAAARYMQGSVYNSPDAAFDSYNLLDCFSTMQASVGGGYSVNFVLWHRDPTDFRDKGLRNLTLNMTAMPVLTVFNYLKTVSYEYEYDEEGHRYSGENVSKVLCRPVPNYIGSAALGFTYDRFFFSAQFIYNRFYFRSRDAFNASQVEVYELLEGLGYKGVFNDWALKGLLVYRF